MRVRSTNGIGPVIYRVKVKSLYLTSVVTSVTNGINESQRCALCTRFGVKGSAIAWFESYLASRKYYVQVEGYKSSLRSLDSGVPQGSVLGPLLYVLYTSPVADIIKSHDLQYHFYADDTQLYITFNTDSADDACLAKSRVEHCVEEIDRWMISNKLKLNVDKTELIAFSSKYRPKPCLSNVQIGSECI